MAVLQSKKYSVHKGVIIKVKTLCNSITSHICIVQTLYIPVIKEHFMVLFKTQVVWIALRRRYRTLIDLEVNRLFRTDTFSTVSLQQQQQISYMPTEHEQTILHGYTVKQHKLSCHSPLFLEISKNHDYRVLGIGYINFPR